MPEDLDKLFNDYESSKKQKEEESAAAVQNMKNKQDAFVAEYVELLKTVINPTIKSVKESLTSRKHSFTSPPSTIRDKYLAMSNVLSNVIKLQGKRASVKITIAGNQYHEQMWVDVTFSDVKKATNSELRLSLADINEEKIKGIFTEVIKTLMSEN